MNKTEAEKLAREGPESGYILIKIGYSEVLVPYKAGITLIGSLEKAEMFVNDYNKPIKIKQVTDTDINFKILSSKEYINIKMAELLGIDPKDMNKEEETSKQ